MSAGSAVSFRHVSRHFGAVTSDGVAAVYSPVDGAAFSQEVIDRRAGDLEWLGAIGIIAKYVIAIVTTCGDVVGPTGKEYPWRARHRNHQPVHQ